MRILSLVVTLLLAGCASYAQDQYKYNFYATHAEEAIKAGDWVVYRSNLQAAIDSADSAEAWQSEKSRLYYEYGRASGVLCDWKEAERGLMKALEIRKSIGMPTSAPLVELGRISVDRQDYEGAEKYFSEAYPILQRADAANRFPSAFVAYLDEYATAWEHLHKDAQAASLRARAIELRNTHATTKSTRTPYGTQCPAPPKT